MYLAVLIFLVVPCVDGRYWTEGMPPAPHIPVFQFPLDGNRTVSINDWTGVLAEGKMEWKYASAAPASFSVLQSLLAPEEVDLILAELSDPSFEFDEDSDSVDGLATFEFYLQRSGNIDGIKNMKGKPDEAREIFDKRRPIRNRLDRITSPIVNNRILPYVNEKYKNACNSTDKCYVCHSLVRRYVDGERLAHPRHYDTQALVTAVISLSSSGRDFDGGIYVSTGAGRGQSYFVGLQAGDALFHQYNLLHGVRVDRGSRWSWILWFKDSPDCDEEGDIKWTSDLAHKGDAVAQFIHAKRGVNNITHKAHWLNVSAHAGLARAANELGVLYMDGEGVDKNITLAKEWLVRSSLDNEPEAFYNLGLLAVKQSNYSEAAINFEVAAAHGVSLASYNLGVAYYMGASVVKDLFRAAQWFERAGTGPSLLLAAKIMNAGDTSTPTSSPTYFRPDRNLSLSLARRSAISGHIPACLFIADVLLKDNRRAEAMRWLKRAEKNGSLDASQILHTMAPASQRQEGMDEL